MHYPTYAVVLAAGSSIVSAEPHPKLASLGKQIGSTHAKPVLPHSLASGGNSAKKPMKLGVPQRQKSPKNTSQPKLKHPLSKGPHKEIPPSKGNHGSSTGGQIGTSSPRTNPGQSSKTSSPTDPRMASMMAKADEAAEITAEYNKKYKQMSPPGLKNDQPPPISFNMGNTYSGPVNDYSQTAYGGGSNARDGASANQNSQVDKSMNDNRVQAAAGSTVTGSGNNSRSGPNGPGKVRRDTPGTYEMNEDGKVVSRDIILLAEVMKRDPEAKNQVLYEIAGIPGLRPMVEKLIRQYTDTDGQLTMNHFASLVQSMKDDQEAAEAVVNAFNSNLIYAFLVEKLLTKYYSNTEDVDLKAREVYDEYSELSLRDVEDWENLLEARDNFDDYLWLDARGLSDPASNIMVKRANAHKALEDFSQYTQQWVRTNGGAGCQLSADQNGTLNAKCKLGSGGLVVHIVPGSDSSKGKNGKRSEVFDRRWLDIMELDSYYS